MRNPKFVPYETIVRATTGQGTAKFFTLLLLLYLTSAIAAGGSHVIPAVLPAGIFIILFSAVSEYFSAYLSSYTCEIFAHEMRMGYVRYYLQGNIRVFPVIQIYDAY